MTEREIFLALLDLPDAAARTDYLDRVCGSDPARRARIESLLLSHDTVGSFLGNPAVHPPESYSGATQELLSGATPEGANETDADLDFLDKPRRPDSLGRIGHYEVLQVLGRGGFGIVFRAFDEALQRVVAIKVLSPQMAATSPARKRFLREARSSARVRHENVVQVYAVEEQPLPFLVMEFIPGETLQQRLDRTGPLEAQEVARIGRQIAEGLAAAHGMGLIHRDIKPANILIESGPHLHVKITDFGLARAADDASLTQSGMVAGTPMYMAPEQAQDEKLDHRADLFSLGSVLYAICSGRPPFRANSTLAVLKRVAEDTPRPITEIIPETPRWLCDIIARLQAKKPEDRFATATEVADLLAHGLLDMQRLDHVPPPAMEKVPREGEAPAEPKEIPATAPTIKPRFRTGRWAAAAVFLVVLGGLGLTEATGVTKVRGTVVRLFSPEGTLVVEVDDPTVSIKIDGSDIVITGAGAREIRLKPGNYTVEASKDGKLVSRELVTVTKNDRQVVRVSLEAPPKPTDTKAAKEKKDPDRRAAEWALALGGAVTIEDGQMREISAAKDLPAGPWKLRHIGFQDNQRVDDSGVKNLAGLKNLQTLSLWATKVTDTGLKELAGLKSLESLNLEGTRITDSGLKNLAGLKRLVYLNLYQVSQVTDTGLKELAGLKNLQTLNLAGTKVTGTGLKELKNLQALWLAYTPVTDAGLKELAELKNLQTLLIYGTQLTDTGLKELAKLKNLQTLDIRSTQVTDAGVKKLAAVLPLLKIQWDGVKEAKASLDPDRRAAEYVLSIGGAVCVNGQDQEIKAAADLPKEAFRLTQVNLEETKVSDAGLAHFKDNKNLTHLNLDHTQVSDTGLAHLAGCKNLEYLNIGHTQMSDAGLAWFANCKNLMHLNLDGSQVGDKGLAHIKDCMNLKVLWVQGTQVGDSGLAHLKECKNLTELLLNGSPVTDAGLAHLKACKSLTHLELKNTLDNMKVSDAGLAHLKDCKNLTELYLYGNKVTATGIDELKKTLPKCKIDASTP